MLTLSRGSASCARFTTLLILLQLGYTSLSAQSFRIYVDQGAIGNNTGENWSNAFTDLQEALEVAQYGDTIWVAQGIYRPTSSIDRTVSFELKNGVALMGGFLGNEVSLSQRNIENAETILSGDIGVEGDSLDNTYNVVYAIGVDSSTILDGFTISEGVANYEDLSFSSRYIFGAGVLIETSNEVALTSPKIHNCKIIDNSAWNGGGIAIRTFSEQRGTVILEDCQLLRNRAEAWGGGIFYTGDTPHESSMKVYRCHFQENKALIRGGGIFLGQGKWKAEFSEVLFERNECLDFGGGVAIENGTAKTEIDFNKCQFLSNEGQVGAGIGIYLQGTNFVPTEDYEVRLRDCYFQNNGIKYREGGAFQSLMALENLHVQMTGCRMLNNYSTSSRGSVDLYGLQSDSITLNFEGSSIANPVSQSTGIRVSARLNSPGKVSIKNSLLTGCNGALGVSGYKSVYDVELYNSTFINNGDIVLSKQYISPTETMGQITTLQAVNCIFSEPTSQLDKIFHNAYAEGVPPLTGFILNHNLISVPACDLPGGEGACGAGNLFDINPHFRDSLNGDFRLAGCSPAINAGVDNDSIGEFDLDGNPRVLEDRIDLGAYEQETFDLAINSVQAEAVSCFGEEDGAVGVITTGVAPLSYVWTRDGVNGEGNTDLEPGLYAMTVTDQLSCKENLFVQIDEPDSLFATFTAIPATPGQNDGYITLDQITGGRQPYQWNWSNGATSASLDGLSNGTYEVTLTDGNGCSKIWAFFLEAPDASVEPSEKAHFIISPNPLTNDESLRISYKLSNSQECEIHLRDLLGRRLQASTMRLNQSGNFRWSVGPLAKGSYLLQIIGERGKQLAVERILIVE